MMTFLQWMTMILEGGITCHKKFDDATAVLVGDAFQSLAFRDFIKS